MKPTRHSALFLIALLVVLCSCQREAGKGLLAGKEGRAVSFDGIPIFYKTYGGGQVALVFVHGWCTDMEIWKGQIPSFALNYRVVTLDLAGHGRSGSDRKAWTMEAFGQDIVSVINKLDLNNAVLIGHSLGGAAVLEAARQIPDLMTGLVGVEAFSDLYLKGYSQEEAKKALSLWQPDFPSRMMQFVRETYFTRRSAEKIMKKIILQMGNAPPQVALGSLEELLIYDGSEALREIRCPVRALNSDSASPSFEVAKACSTSFRADYMPWLGHFVMLEDPLVFNRLLAQYIAEFVTES